MPSRAAPTADPTGIPALSPEALDQCSNGIAVRQPERNPELVRDCAALLSAKESLDRSGLLNWSPNVPIGNCQGVGVDGSPNRLVHIYIVGKGLVGVIPKELVHLAALDDLILSDNQLSGTIPPELGLLANLERLGFRANRLTGEIPPEIANLEKLLVLGLGDNQLSGEIPPELGHMDSLGFLSLGGNRLTGGIPPELAQLTDLSTLYLGNNRLTGEIPPWLGELTFLEQMSLSNNRLTGEIPTELGNLAYMEQLSLNGNQLTGGLPSQLGNLTYLTQLTLCCNHLTGEIPPELGNLIYLQVLDLGGNRLSGEIPSELGDLASLFRLDLRGNGLEGCVPRALRDVETSPGLEFCDYAEATSGETSTGAGTGDGEPGIRGEIMLSPELVAVCSNGVAVPDPGDNPGLVNDCAALLAARDTLVGIGRLDWNANTSIYQWDGISLRGSPPRVYDLETISKVPSPATREG